MLRHWLLALVCLALSLQAMATVRSTHATCPMAAEAAAMLASGDAAPSALPDCCQDMDALVAGEHACKSGQECGVATPLLTACAPGPAHLAAGTSRPQSSMTPWLAGPPGSPWRPPTFL